ncbi:dipeptidase [Acidobacteriota bacterium]
MSIVIDGHSDLLNDIFPRRTLGEREILEKYWVPKMRKGGIDTRVVAIYSDPRYLPELALRRALDQIAILYEEIEESPSSVLCTTADEIIRAKKEGKVGFILGMEGAEPLGSDIQLLRIFYKLGLRVLGFTHALRTYLADGAFFISRESGQLGGLTDVGIQFLELAQALGIVVDLSHMNDPSFWDTIKFAKLPVIASHSNCRALCNHPRNLTNEQISAIADGGGVIGVNSIRRFIEHKNLDDLVNHIDHLVSKAGIEHVGLGPDFADYLRDYMTEKERESLHPDSMRQVEGFAQDEDFPLMARELERRGYKSSDIEAIMGDNFMRVFQELL